jgi:pSer/pThr/pTyr-binding forkhead associated (FHA) protein/RNA polymerase subunit RPABC4/transcription elongation factor Spt4
MDHDIGIACGRCDTFHPMGAAFCASCGNNLSFHAHSPHVTAAAVASPAAGEHAAPAIARSSFEDAAPAQTPLTEDPMEQNRYYVCKECSSPVPPGHKFCGACGSTVPDDSLERKVEFFGTMQAPGKARLILIRGTDGADGLSYLLQGLEHVTGRTNAQIPFPNDPFVSERHANFIYRGEKLVVRDEGSLNGVYVRVRQPVSIAPGDLFLCGEEVFRLEATPKDTAGPDPDQTYFYSSPKRPSPFRIVQVLRGGSEGMVYCARDTSVQIGREDSEMNFPDDIFMSGRHAKLELAPDGTYTLHDLGSRNGTYVRIRGERELAHGDYLFLGQQLLRVEQTA